MIALVQINFYLHLGNICENVVGYQLFASCYKVNTSIYIVFHTCARIQVNVIFIIKLLNLLINY